MASPIPVFDYVDYRLFIADLLKAKRLSQRAFEKKFGHVVSRNALAKLVSRGKNKRQTRSMYRMSPETLVKLLKLFDLTDNETSYILLVKLHNDAEILPAKWGATCKRLYSSWIKKFKAMNENQTEVSKSFIQHSKTAYLIAEIFDCLEKKQRETLIEEVFYQLKVSSERKSYRPGHSHLKELFLNLTDLTTKPIPSQNVVSKGE